MAERHPPHTADGQAGNLGVHHETSDVDIRAVLGFLVALIVVGVLIHLTVALLFRYFEAREARHQAIDFPLAAAEGHRLPPEPRLQTNPRQDLRDLRAHEQEILTSYGWIDKNAGIVRIPIDQAMKLTVERGLPARKATR